VKLLSVLGGVVMDRLVSTRRAIVLALGVAAASLAGPAVAQTSPVPGPITVVVNFPAGGGQDRAARLIAEYAQKRSGVPFVVSNVTGAGGATGVRAVAEAKPDGQTIGVLGSATVAQQYINENAPPLSSLDIIAFFGPDPGALEVRADTGFKALDDFVAAAKAKPGSIKNGNDPPGGSSFLVAALLEKKLGIRLSKVPYQGYAPTVAAMLSGEVQSATLPVHQFADQHKAGAVRVLAVAANERHFMTPDVPTFKDLGVDFVTGDWRAVYGPVGIPADRRAWLEKLMVDTMSDPEFKAAAERVGFVVTPMGTDGAMAEIKKWDDETYPILQEAGLVKIPRK
jgi:tripartite-type tricarboxylate transporter receptor subunit TctC